MKTATRMLSGMVAGLAVGTAALAKTASAR